MKQHEQLRKYNRWRRGDKRLKQPDPKKLGELIDSVADRLEVLEREHAEFFERWHNERRKRETLANDVERCYRMLLSEPDTKGALFKAENILREALAEANAKTPMLGVTKKENKMSEGSNKIQELVLDGDEGQVTFTLDDHGLVVEVFQQNFLSETIRRGDVHKLIAWLVINVLTPNK